LILPSVSMYLFYFAKFIHISLRLGFLRYIYTGLLGTV